MFCGEWLIKEVLDQLYDHYLQKWILKNLITFVIGTSTLIMIERSCFESHLSVEKHSSERHSADSMFGRYSNGLFD